MSDKPQPCQKPAPRTFTVRDARRATSLPVQSGIKSGLGKLSNAVSE